VRGKPFAARYNSRRLQGLAVRLPNQGEDSTVAGTLFAATAFLHVHFQACR
jgi:hypothetical protein